VNTASAAPEGFPEISPGSSIAKIPPVGKFFLIGITGRLYASTSLRADTRQKVEGWYWARSQERDLRV
jgi:hypothetical protein